MNVWTYWKCSSCRSIIRGDSRECPNCGTPIPNNVKYLMPDNPEIQQAIRNGTILVNISSTITDEKGNITEVVSKEEERFNPNWNCHYCGYQNKDENLTCEGCGALKSESTSNYFQETKPYIEKYNIDTTEFDNDTTDTTNNSSNNYLRNYYNSDSNFDEFADIDRLGLREISIWDNVKDFFSVYWKYITCSIAALFLLSFIIWLFIPVERQSKVQDFYWNRSIAIEEYQLCHESDWSLPSGATLTDTQQEIHHYNKVLDHYETKTKKIQYQEIVGYNTVYKDLGNGQATAERVPIWETKYRTETYQEAVYKKVPEYRTKYYYDIGRWKTVSSIDTSALNKKPYWGKTDLPTSVSNPKYGARRQGSKKEHYYVYIVDEKGKKQKVEYSYNEWLEIQLGDTITYKTFRFSQTPLRGS